MWNCPGCETTNNDADDYCVICAFPKKKIPEKGPKKELEIEKIDIEPDTLADDAKPVADPGSKHKQVIASWVCILAGAALILINTVIELRDLMFDNSLYYLMLAIGILSAWAAEHWALAGVVLSSEGLQKAHPVWMRIQGTLAIVPVLWAVIFAVNWWQRYSLDFYNFSFAAFYIIPSLWLVVSGIAHMTGAISLKAKDYSAWMLVWAMGFLMFGWAIFFFATNSSRSMWYVLQESSSFAAIFVGALFVLRGFFYLKLASSPDLAKCFYRRMTKPS